jgi:uncharacterized coiled-coil protein SlyX
MSKDDRIKELAQTMKEWSDTAGDHHWQAGCVIEQLKAEVERLQEQCNHLVDKFKAEIEVSYTKRNNAEQERDQLRERLTHTQKFLATGIHYTYQQLAVHDAEVIERFCDYAQTKYHFGLHSVAKDYANQLRQQAKEVQS